MLPERSTNWDKIEYDHRLQEHTKGWWESAQWSTAHNWLDVHSGKHQPSGVALGLINTLIHWAGRPGDDKACLRRWCWARLRGKITCQSGLWQCTSHASRKDLCQPTSSNCGIQTFTGPNVPGHALWWNYSKKFGTGSYQGSSYWSWGISMMTQPR